MRTVTVRRVRVRMCMLRTLFWSDSSQKEGRRLDLNTPYQLQMGSCKHFFLGLPQSDHVLAPRRSQTNIPSPVRHAHRDGWPPCRCTQASAMAMYE